MVIINKPNKKNKVLKLTKQDYEELEVNEKSINTLLYNSRYDNTKMYESCEVFS